MTKVTVEYLQANGRYRRATAHTESQWPTFLVNHTDKQAHSLVDSPVFPVPGKAPIYTDWESFLTAKPPPAIHYPDKMLAVCEDQNIWPICGDIMPDIQDRQMQFKEFAEDAEQNAVATATRAAAGNSLITAWSVASLMVFCIVSAIILLVVLQSNLAQQFIPQGLPGGAPAAALLTMMGAVLPWGKGKKGEGPRIELQSDSAEVVEPDSPPDVTDEEAKALWVEAPKKNWRLLKRTPKPKKFKDFETVRVWDETTNSTWSASLPLEVLVARIPLECRYTQELTTARRMGMGFFGGLAFLVVLLATTALHWPLLWAFVVPALVAPVGILYGFFKGFGMFMLPPIWIVRRMHQRLPVDPHDERKGYRLDYDSLPIVVPEIHTKLTGMPLEIAVSERRASAEEVIRSANAQQQQNGGKGVASVISKENLAVAYTPRIWRAFMLYEMLKGRDIKARMKGPGGAQDKIQKISMAGMALGSIGLLIAALVFLGN